jgi:hypothetical protein
MKIEHINGNTVDTDKLPDVDALLMEASKVLHEQFSRYNRQLFLVGEMKSTEDKSARNDCVFFHVGVPGSEKQPEEFNKAIGRYYGRIDRYVRMMSDQSLGIGRIPPPQVEPYPEKES